MSRCVTSDYALRGHVVALSFGLSMLAATAPAIAAPGTRAASVDLATPTRPAAAKPVETPLIAVISIDNQRVTIWSGDSIVARSPVSTGMSGHRTPTGVFSVIGKEKYHESNLYSNAPMPFMQRITWSGVAMHAGHLPGYPASHGCVRMPEDFAQRLFSMTRTGMRVIVSDRDVAPTGIVHPTLPTPTFVRETQVASFVAPSRIAAPAAAVIPASLTNALAPLEGRMQLGTAPDSAERLLNPMERGKLEYGLTKVAALEAEGDAQALLEIAVLRGTEVGLAAEKIRSLDASLSALRAGRDKAREASIDGASSDEQRARSASVLTELAAALTSTEQRRDEALNVAHAADMAAFHAAAEAKAAVAERDALQDATRIAARATEPVSVFVSRRLHRVFVRQGFEPVFEADIEIADADVPLGTHVFTAIAPTADGGALQWVSLTVPEAGSARDQPKARGAKAGNEPAEARSLPTAVSALERVKFSDAAMQKISEKLWTGASLMISDHGPSHETGKGTDFVLLTRSSE